MEQSIFDIAVGGLVLLFVMGIIWMLGNFIIGAEVHPLIKSMNPNSTEGIGYTEYNDIADKLNLGEKLFFYIIIGVIFLFILMKALFNREEQSTPGLYYS